MLKAMMMSMFVVVALGDDAVCEGGACEAEMETMAGSSILQKGRVRQNVEETELVSGNAMRTPQKLARCEA